MKHASHLPSLSRTLSSLLLLMIATWGMASEPPPGELVKVGQLPGHTHHLHIHCSGRGGPTVILEAGLGGTAMEWDQVQHLLAPDHRVCSYDRAGMGWSEPAPGARTSEQITEELRELLTTAGIPGPYVLVGHSFGGYTVQLFAARYPELSAGLVLVDSSHPEQIDRFAAPPVRTTIAPRGRLMILMSAQVPEQLPEPHRLLALHLANRYESRLMVTRELEGYRASAAQLQAAAPLPDIPLVVLSRGLQQWPDDERGNLKEALWQELQTDLSRRSGLGIQIAARRSGHHIHLDQPELVAGAVRIAVLAAGRYPDRTAQTAVMHAAVDLLARRPASDILVGEGLLADASAWMGRQR